MKTGRLGIDLIKKYEGFRSEPYKCSADVPTIGYGATYYPGGRKVSLDDAPISKKKAEDLLKDMVGVYEAGVNRYVQSKITQNQFDALVSFAYNLGVGALQKSTLLKKVNIDPCDPKISKEFKKWVRAGGKVLKGLQRRRKEEAELYFT